MSTKDKTYWIMLLFILAGLIIGTILGDMAKTIPSFSILALGKSVGLDTCNLNLGFLNLNFGFNFEINLASFLGIVIALILYKWLVR